MILINEWLPNPTGDDAAGEWAELLNTGSSTVNLRGWSLVLGNGKKFVAGDTAIAPQGYLVLPRSVTKLVLRNQDETLSLYDAQSTLQDTTHFTGAATEGKSFARDGDIFVLANPTPGAPNVIEHTATLAGERYAAGTTFDSSPSAWGVLGLALIIAALIAGVTFYCIKQNHGLSKLFFGKD